MSIFIFVGFKTIDRTPCNFSELMTNIAPSVAFTLILPINSGYLLFCELVVICKKRFCKCIFDIRTVLDKNLDGSVGLILKYRFNSFFLRREGAAHILRKHGRGHTRDRCKHQNSKQRSEKTLQIVFLHAMPPYKDFINFYSRIVYKQVTMFS